MKINAIACLCLAISLTCQAATPRVSNTVELPPTPTGTVTTLTPEQRKAIEAERQRNIKKREQAIRAKHARWMHRQRDDAASVTKGRAKAERESREKMAARALVNRAAAIAKVRADNLWAKRKNVIRKGGPDPDKGVFMRRDSRGRPVYFANHSVRAAFNSFTFHVWDTQLGTTNIINPIGVDGHGTTVYQWDGGSVYDIHREFTTFGNRVVNVTTQPIHVHATQVASVMAGFGSQGFGQLNIAGTSRRAMLRAYSFLDQMDQQEVITEIGNGMRLSNHSYGLIAGWQDFGFAWRWFGDSLVDPLEDYQFGFYGPPAEQWDTIAYDAPHYLHVRSAGNDRDPLILLPAQPFDHEEWDPVTESWVVVSGATRAKDGEADHAGFDTMPANSVAKNILTVGSIFEFGGAGYEPAPFTAYGPTDDGRIKPDVVAEGFGLVSAGIISPITEIPFDGTSASAPVVTGAANLLVQQHARVNPLSAPMLASTVKGLLIHTAADLIATNAFTTNHPGPGRSPRIPSLLWCCSTTWGW